MSELPSGWTVAKLSELTDKLVDGSHNPPAKADVGKPMLSARNIENRSIIFDDYRLIAEAAFDREHMRTRIRPGDVLLTIVGAIGRSAVVPEQCPEFTLQRSVAVLGPNDAVDSEFISYALHAPDLQEWLNDNAKGTAQKGIYLKALGQAALPVAPLAEQLRIVAKLSKLRTRSASARRQLDRALQLIDRYKRSILRSALKGEITKVWRETNTGMEPVTALLSRVETPEQPRGGREATDSIIPGSAALSVNHPRTKPPRGWQWTPLLRIARQETGHTPSRSKAKYWNAGIPWIGIKDANLHHGKVISETIQTVSRQGLENSSARLLPAGTVCLSRTASVGYVTIMGRPMATSQDFATWTCTPALLPKFLMYALMAEGDDIRNFGEGSTHTTIYFPEIRALHICLPPIEEQAEIVRRVEKALAWIDKIAAKHARAEQLLPKLDQAILAKAFRGELVPQDPNDEPASVLLERINAQREKNTSARRGRARRAK